MTDESSPDALPAPDFPAALRGYDRSAVDAYIRSLKLNLLAAEAKLNEAGSGLSDDAVDPKAVRRELEAVGSEVAAILEAAQSAADGMRARAAEDAARWRADADREARDLRESAEKASQAARGDAWETSTEMLEQASHESDSVLENARQDALYIRAEAEHEAVRLTGDARRDAEEAIRAGRGDAERLVADAQAEAQTTLDNARRSAELAQERARALERRREELMEELELARRSIGEIEGGNSPASGPVATSAAPAQEANEPVKASGRPPAEWVNDDASVRIVPATKLPPEEPVDTDSFLAEVEQLRSTPAAEPAPAATAADGGWLDVLDEHAEDDAEPVAGAPIDPSPLASEEELAAADDGSREPEADDLVADSPPPSDPAPVAASVASESKSEARPSGELDDLFATLREPSADPETEATELGRSPGAQDGRVAVEDPGTASETGEKLTVQSLAVVDPFDLKERMLLPIENRALRGVKRRIVDLQNRVLEELRVGGDDWRPDRALFAASIGDEVAVLTQESYVAGFAGAAELVGEAATPPPDRAADQDTTTEFVDAALEATEEALERARATGGGARQVSAAVSRVFRAWRTDEAERRLRHMGAKAYHSGILDALAGLGVGSVAAVTQGNPCGACPAGTGAVWSPGDRWPPETALPPAIAGCTATIVPAAAV